MGETLPYFKMGLMIHKNRKYPLDLAVRSEGSRMKGIEHVIHHTSFLRTELRRDCSEEKAETGLENGPQGKLGYHSLAWKSQSQPQAQQEHRLCTVPESFACSR